MSDPNHTRRIFGRKALLRFDRGATRLVWSVNYSSMLPVIVMATLVTVGVAASPHVIGQQVNQLEISPDSVDETQLFDWTEKRYLRYEDSGAHCGVYSSLAAIRAFGRSVDARTLVDPKYISSRHGSTAKDLKQLFEDHGLKANIVAGINGTFLRASPHPVLVHLQKLREVEGTHHWVLYHGDDQGMALVYDPPHAVSKWTYGDLLAFASGYGILVSADGISSIPTWSNRLEILIWISGSILGLIILSKLFRGRQSTKPSIVWQFAGIGGLATVLVGIQQLVPWESVLTDQVSVGHIKEVYQRPIEVEIVTFAELEKLIDSQNVNVVDARLPSAFGRGRIAGAINWPVDATVVESRAGWSLIDPHKPTVVYCQSLGCAWDQIVATRLVARGLDSVFVYQGGWSEWNSSGGKTD